MLSEGTRRDRVEKEDMEASILTPPDEGASSGLRDESLARNVDEMDVIRFQSDYCIIYMYYTFHFIGDFIGYGECGNAVFF